MSQRIDNSCSLWKFDEMYWIIYLMNLTDMNYVEDFGVILGYLLYVLEK